MRIKTGPSGPHGGGGGNKDIDRARQEVQERGTMSEFMERFGNLTVGEAIALNKAAENSMGDPSAFDGGEKENVNAKDK